MLRLGDQAYPMVGVVPDSFRFPAEDVDVWIRAYLPPSVMRAREARFYNSVGRIKEGIKPAAAQADLAAVQGRLALQFPTTDGKWTALVEPLKEGTVCGGRKSPWILVGAVSLVPLIACAHVS